MPSLHENVLGVLADESAEEKRPIKVHAFFFWSRKFRDALRVMLKSFEGSGTGRGPGAIRLPRWVGVF